MAIKARATEIEGQCSVLSGLWDQKDYLEHIISLFGFSPITWALIIEAIELDFEKCQHEIRYATPTANHCY